MRDYLINILQRVKRMWYYMNMKNKKQRRKVEMNKKTAESLVAVHTHTHCITK